MASNIEQPKNKLIVIEGACDGIGKSTQFKRLCDHLIEDGEEVVNHHFPSYGTMHGAPVESYLKGELGDKNRLSPEFIHALYAYDRKMAWENILGPKFDEGKQIVLDRYTTSSLIYQAANITDEQKKKDFIKYVIDLEYGALGIKEPDNVIFLHAPFDLVTEIRNARKENDGIANDIHERDIEFMKRVYDNAMFLAEYLNWDAVRCNDGDKLRSIEEIHDDVYKLVRK